MTWPLIRPAAARAAAIVFPMALLEPGVPLILGLRRTLAFQIVEAAGRPDPFPRLAVWTVMAAAHRLRRAGWSCDGGAGRSCSLRRRRWGSAAGPRTVPRAGASLAMACTAILAGGGDPGLAADPRARAAVPRCGPRERFGDLVLRGDRSPTHWHRRCRSSSPIRCLLGLEVGAGRAAPRLAAPARSGPTARADDRLAPRRPVRPDAPPGPGGGHPRPAGTAGRAGRRSRCGISRA